MVKKLFKHEMTAYYRAMLPMQFILLGIAVLTRLVQFFESDKTVYGIIFGSAVTAYVVAVIVCLIMTFVVGITRFYRNLFTGEGYLSFTLPVTTRAHILTKLAVSVIFTVFSLIAVLVSFALVTMGDAFAEIVKACAYITRSTYNSIGTHLIFYVIEAIVLALLAVASSYLLVYGCISLGQTAKKNRILAAFGFYFAYYFITQILGTIFIIFINEFSDCQLFYNIGRFADNHTFAFVHIMLCLLMLWYLLTSLMYYFVSHIVIKKKLNLE